MLRIMVRRGFGGMICRKMFGLELYHTPRTSRKCWYTLLSTSRFDAGPKREFEGYVLGFYSEEDDDDGDEGSDVMYYLNPSITFL